MRPTASRYTFLVFLILLLVLTFLVIKPYLTAILTGMILAYIFYPVYTRLNNKLRMPSLSAFLSALLLLLIISIPLIIFLNTITQDVAVFYITTKQRLSENGFFGQECVVGTLCEFNQKVIDFFKQPEVATHVQASLGKLSVQLLDYTSNLLVALPKRIINFIIALFVMYYFFRDGPQIVRKFVNLLPFKQHFKIELLEQTKDVIFATVYGTIFVALLQGFLAFIGFLVFGVSSPIIFALMTMFAALIPFVGPATIWFPVAAYLFLTGYATQNPALMWKGIGLAVYGFVLLSGVDNLLKPKIIGQRAKLHPVTILIGILGGLHLFGAIGLILGPLVFAILFSFIRVYEREKEELLG